MADLQQHGANEVLNTENLLADISVPLEEKLIQNPDTKSAEYIPHSQICNTVDTVANVQMLYEMNKSIGEINRKVRGVDEYVRAKLRYDDLIDLCTHLSAEQVDAIAVAIYNIEEKNQALIVGDMTGVGKGRIAAAIMRYARLQGKTPIFFTEKTNLFSDIYRDIIEIGSDRGVIQDRLTGEREKEVKTTIKEIKERIQDDIENGNFDLDYDIDKLFSKSYEKETRDCIEEYRELYFPTTTRVVNTYERNHDYEKEFKRIDKKFVPFIVNNRSDKTHVYDVNGNIIYKSLDNATKKRIFEEKELPKQFDCILLTYSQIRNPAKGKEKSEFIQAMAQDNIIIMDESHNASGTSNTGRYLQELLGRAWGATFLSATFAKRPDNMPIYAQKTSMQDAELSSNDLIEAILRGGVALQEILSADLVAEAQMLRRERSYEGVDVNYIYMDETVEEIDNPFYNPSYNLKEQHRAISDKITSIVRNIMSFQRDYVNPVIENMDVQFAKEQESVKQVQQIQEAGINNPPIFNGIFNLINQLLLSIKSESIADWAIMRMKQGKKPIIALANTMESFLDYIQQEEKSNTIKTDFSTVLKRRLKTTLKYTRRYPDGTNEVEFLNPAEMNAPFQDAYNELEAEINRATIGINISPIDVILTRIEKAGFSVAEVTGRGKYLEFTSKNKGVIKTRTRPNNSELFRKFNDNEIDCLLINQSGATGASAHSIRTKKVSYVHYDKDGSPIIPKSLDNRTEVKQRVMIVLQAELNVNTEVQKRGRINRTGQVFPPIYDYLISAIPAEQRLMMMLQKKLKSLDANTTSNQKQSSKIIDTVDFLNLYGDDVIVDYMKQNPATNTITGNILKFENNEPTEETYRVEDRAHRVSGRIAILSTEMQEDFYGGMIEGYNAHVQKKKDAGEYNLEVERIDLKARTIETNVIEPPKTEGRRSVFSEGVYLEKCECQNLRKPFEKDQVEAMIEKALTVTEDDGTELKMTPEQLMNYHLERAKKHFDLKQSEDLADAQFMRERDLKGMKESKTYENLENETQRKEYIKEKTGFIEEQYEERVEKINKSIDNLRATIERNIKFFYAKRKIAYPLQNFETEGNRSDGICLGVKINYKAKNPFAPSAIEVPIILANSLRRVSPKLTDTFLANIKDATQEYESRDMEQSIYYTDTLIEEWEAATKESRSDKVFKYIVTGNLLKALGNAEFRNSAKLITFTTIDNKIRKGVLLPDTFKPQAYDVIIGILRALPVILAMSSERGQQMRIKNRAITIAKSGNYWKLMASTKGADGIHKNLEFAKEYSIEEQWEKRGDVWTLTIEKPKIKEAITYLDNKYKYKIALAPTLFDSWKDRLGFTDAIEEDLSKKEDGVQEVLHKYNEAYDEHERKKDAELEVVEEIESPEKLAELEREKSVQDMKLKMVRLYFTIKNAMKQKAAATMAKGGTIEGLTPVQRKQLRYYLSKYKLGNETHDDLVKLINFVDSYYGNFNFTDWGKKQSEYYIKKHNLGNMKPYEYKTFADVMLTEFESHIFKN